jgi:hypothetical protein
MSQLSEEVDCTQPSLQLVFLVKSFNFCKKVCKNNELVLKLDSFIGQLWNRLYVLGFDERREFKLIRY